MRLLKTILVAVDFDDTLEPVLATASTVAKKFGAEIILAHVIAVEHHFGQVSAALRESITARLEQVQQQLIASGVKVPQVVCPSGRPSVQIEAAADGIGANLIVLGAHAVGTARPIAIGTTAEDVIRHSPRPVLTVPLRPAPGVANILCPVDFSEASARGLSNALHLARAFGSKLRILTVVTAFSSYRRLDPLWAEREASSEQAVMSRCQRAFDDFLAGFDFRDVTWERDVVSGDPAHEIVTQARNTHADLIVMGSEGRVGLPYAFLGSTAVKVARQLPCALLTLKRMRALAPDVAAKLADIHTAFAEGQSLLTQGFCPEAIARFDQCLSIDARCVDALEAKAEALDRLGRPEQADECRKLAESIRRELEEQRVTASVRAQHPSFHRRGPQV
jgi:nucleotide-binding universal stress UspA family protein